MAGEIILIVEDNDVLRQGLQALRGRGFRCPYRHSWPGWIRKSESLPRSLPRPISMPEMDGYAFFEAVWGAVRSGFLSHSSS